MARYTQAEFKQLNSSVNELFSVWFENLNTKPGSFFDLQREMRRTYIWLKDQKQSISNDLAAIRERSAGIMDSGYLQLQEFETLKRFQENTVDKTIDATKTQIDSLIDIKRKGLMDMQTTPPTSAQMQLLQAFRLRRGNVSRSELQRILPTVFDNYLATQILASIAAESGIRLILPDGYSLDQRFEDLGECKRYLYARAEGMRNIEALDPRDKPFFMMPPETNPDMMTDPLYNKYIAMYDYAPQLNQTLVIPEGLSATEHVRIQSYFQGLPPVDDSGSWLVYAQRMRQVLAEHPEDRAILEKSEYKAFIELADMADQPTDEQTDEQPE